MVLPIIFCQKLTKNDHFEKGTPYTFLSKTDQFGKEHFPKKTLTRSDEKSCTKNLANTDLANTDIFKIVIESDENHNHFPKEII